MKTLLSRSAAFIGFLLIACAPVRALDFNMNGSTGVVGTFRSGEPSSIADEVAYVNWLLGLGADVTDIHNFGNPQDPYTFQTSLVDFNGTVNVADAIQNQTLGGMGFDYVMAKFDGPNGGDVLWYVGGAAFSPPGDSVGLWANNAGQGYGLSHWTGFGSTSVPDSGMTAIFLGLGLLVVSIATYRRRLI